MVEADMLTVVHTTCHSSIFSVDSKWNSNTDTETDFIAITAHSIQPDMPRSSRDIIKWHSSSCCISKLCMQLGISSVPRVIIHCPPDAIIAEFYTSRSIHASMASRSIHGGMDTSGHVKFCYNGVGRQCMMTRGTLLMPSCMQRAWICSNNCSISACIWNEGANTSAAYTPGLLKSDSL